MPPSFEEISRGVFGALMLARGEPRGVDLIDRSAGGAARSFYAAVMMLPIYAVVEAVELSGRTVEAGALEVLAVESLAYVIGWTAFLTAMTWICPLIQRNDRFLDMVATYNWVTLVQMALYFPVAMLVATGVLPPGLVGGLSWIVMLLLLTYTWYALKVSLGIGGGGAAGLVALDLVLGVVLSGVTNGLLGIGPAPA